ncbi:hypothetical protein CDIK_1560, partial [Cucumispora dikerogammari]
MHCKPNKKISGISQITYKLYKTPYTILINTETMELESLDVFKNYVKGEICSANELDELFEYISKDNNINNNNKKAGNKKCQIINYIKTHGHKQIPNNKIQTCTLNKLKELKLYIQSKLLKEKKFLSETEIINLLNENNINYIINNNINNRDKDIKVMGNSIINYLITNNNKYSKIDFKIKVNKIREDFLLKNNISFHIENNINYISDSTIMNNISNSTIMNNISNISLNDNSNEFKVVSDSLPINNTNNNDYIIISLDTKDFKRFKEVFNENLWSYEIL